MATKYKISIPEPCLEDWNKMTPNKNGRFCESCSKNVVDFTNMESDKIQAYFLEHSNVCGRFKSSQLNSLTIQIPNRVLYSQKHFQKAFLLALFIAMGTTLFSCADKNGNKLKIDKIEVVQDTIVKEEHMTVGEMIPSKSNSTNSVLAPPPPPKGNQVKFVKPKKNNYENAIKQDTIVEDEIYNGGIGFEIAPEYNGGIQKFYSFFRNEFKIPENITKENKIIFSFTVEMDGSLTYAQPKSTIDQAVQNEIIRVLKLSPKWKPGEQNGKKTRTQYTMPISLL
ncbi:energy transducer TonB [Flavobacterium sp. 7A]|uniref:energy transducer TonB n=1 Tax=Flavobacterium sp. 7A TaxID=2940571 RepID=UPI002226FC6A|nr:energy transducer TonB [Flavobacterium sp. 7A]MCW2120463.1 hypothetical protein [Flavobacterium sp. 7A]